MNTHMFNQIFELKCTFGESLETWSEDIEVSSEEFIASFNFFPTIISMNFDTANRYERFLSFDLFGGDTSDVTNIDDLIWVKLHIVYDISIDQSLLPNQFLLIYKQEETVI